jgi:acyl carrier protein
MVAPGMKDRAGEGAEGLREVAEALRGYLVELSEGKLELAAVDPDRHLFDHGYVDSLSAVMLIAHIEERWGVQIEDLELVESLTTVNALAARIHQGG